MNEGAIQGLSRPRKRTLKIQGLLRVFKTCTKILDNILGMK